MKWIEIKNKGEICKNAFILLGATNKRGDNSKIGFFGSGLKYGLAVLLRNEIPLKVFTGKKEIRISTKKVMFRDMEFNNIYIEGEKTSLTLEMGIDWEIWQSVREIYCNALDESGSFVKVVDEVIPEQDKTSFYIGFTDQTKEIIDNWNKYFSTDRTDIVSQNEHWQVFHPNDKFTLYRKGIKCLNSNLTSLYDYNLDKIDINESRVVTYNWEVNESLARNWGKFATEVMIKKLFDELDIDHKENEIGWSYAKEFNENWLKVINGRLLIHKDTAGYFTKQIERENCLILKSSLIRALKKYFNDKIKVAGHSDEYDNYVTVPMDKKQTFLTKAVMDFFNEVGLKIEYPIKVAIFKDKSTLGRVGHDSSIILSVGLFEQGKKMIASTILEETLHIESGGKDETRNFQDYIINKMITILENKSGLFL